MEKKTVDLLFEYVRGDYYPDISVLNDYFGTSDDKDKINIIYNIYVGMIKYKNVKKELFEYAFKTNSLDLLIHSKYVHNKSGYYNSFVEKNIKIGNTFISGSAEEIFNPGLDKQLKQTDDYCPNCKNVGYHTNKNALSISYSCVKCCSMTCKMCTVKKKTSSDGYPMCDSCCESAKKSENLVSTINGKLSTYRRNDSKKFGRKGTLAVKHVGELLTRQNYKCYICGDIVITHDYLPHCEYQMSIDRIDETKPHDHDNVLISCMYCNCRDVYVKKYGTCGKKVCKNKCHVEERNIETLRSGVSKSIINKFKLK